MAYILSIVYFNSRTFGGQNRTRIGTGKKEKKGN